METKKGGTQIQQGIKIAILPPLGHAADKGKRKPLNDLTSNQTQSILIISNGHGEDIIALEIIKRLLKNKKF